MNAYKIKTKECVAKINNGPFSVSEAAFGDSLFVWTVLIHEHQE